MAAKKKEVKKAQYYVYYLGWKETIGLEGRTLTDPVVQQLLQIHSRYPYANLNKLTVQINAKEIKITQVVDKGKGKTGKSKLPGIPAKDVTFACQGSSPDDDTVSVIFLGYNPQTKCAVHVHVYRCDSSDTARIMATHFLQVTEIPEHKERLIQIEQDLLDNGHIEGPATIGGPKKKMEKNIRQQGSIYQSVTDELRARLSISDGAPILLPPIDYDTMSRSRGKMQLRHYEKSLQQDSIAPGGVYIRKFHDEPASRPSTTNTSSPDEEEVYLKKYQNHSTSSSGSEQSQETGRQRSNPDDGYHSSHKLSMQSHDMSSRDRWSQEPPPTADHEWRRRTGLEARASGNRLRHTYQEGDFMRKQQEHKPLSTNFNQSDSYR